MDPQAEAAGAAAGQGPMPFVPAEEALLEGELLLSVLAAGAAQGIGRVEARWPVRVLGQALDEVGPS